MVKIIKNKHENNNWATDVFVPGLNKEPTGNRKRPENSNSNNNNDYNNDRKKAMTKRPQNTDSCSCFLGVLMGI